MHSVGLSDDDVRKRLHEKPRLELAAKGAFRLGRCYIFRQGVPGLRASNRESTATDGWSFDRWHRKTTGGLVPVERSDRLPGLQKDCVGLLARASPRYDTTRALPWRTLNVSMIAVLCKTKWRWRYRGSLEKELILWFIDDCEPNTGNTANHSSGFQKTESSCITMIPTSSLIATKTW